MGEPVLLKCVSCGRELDPEPVHFTCPDCGPDGTLDVLYDYAALAATLTRETFAATREPTLWRYARLLPVDDDAARTPLTAGWTPLYRAEGLGRAVGCPGLWVKDDGRNPTASFKDRASAVGVAKALELGVETVTCASTGNAASSLAGIAASVGLRSVIFVPRSAPRAKIAQLLVYGARVILVEGSYDEAFDLCWEAACGYGWYCRNTGVNPYLGEGKKTAALEIVEQMGWRVPDKVFVSVGDGCVVGSLWKGFHDLIQVGLIDRMPQIVGVQAEGCAPIHRAVGEGGAVRPVEPRTLADSIAVGRPRDARKAIRAMTQSGGFSVAVSDEEILDAIRVLGRETGIFGEPAGVTGLAGLRRALGDGRVGPRETVVVLVTGNGLKDVDAAMSAVQMPPVAQADPASVRSAIETHYPECL